MRNINSTKDTIIHGDAVTVLKTLPDESINCCVTSPPYWGPRDYECEGQIGAETTLDEYIESLVNVFREVKRVLRNDGTFWLNIGNVSAGSGYGASKHPGNWPKQNSNKGSLKPTMANTRIPEGYKHKDLIPVAWLIGLALLKDGWYLRSDNIWAKSISFIPHYCGSCMVESTKDRPTRSHEYMLLLTKSERYFYDAEAVKEDGTIPAGTRAAKGSKARSTTGGVNSRPASYAIYDGKRNLRSVWAISAGNYDGDHYAVYPEELVRPCIMAGTSEKGYCSICGAPWIRVIEKSGHKNRRKKSNDPRHETQSTSTGWDRTEIVTGEWQPTCDCQNNSIVKGIVLDPFMGAGTTGLVAKKLNRHYIGIELNKRYIDEEATPRINSQEPCLWSETV